jgi:hypothetical protein
MPRSPTELDVVEHLLQNAAEAIRLMPCGSLRLEQLKTEVYKLVCNAIEPCVNYAYGYLPDLQPPTPASQSETSRPRSSPKSPPEGGRGGVGHRDKATAGGPKTWTFAADLDLLK